MNKGMSIKVRCTKRHPVDADESGEERSALVGFLGVATITKGRGAEDPDYYSVAWDNGVKGNSPTGFYSHAELEEVAEWGFTAEEIGGKQ